MFRYLYPNCLTKNLAAFVHDYNIKKDENKIDNILKKWKRIFLEKCIGEPESSIDNIIAHVLNTKKVSDVYTNMNKYLTFKQTDKITQLCELRLKNKPMQYIIGEWDFKNLTLKMREPVFIPRPETEQIVDLALNECNDVSEILELCCGSGAISIALLKMNPNIKIIAIDKSNEACALTEENAKIHGVFNRLRVINKEILEENVSQLILKKFKLIVSNPPYIPTGDIEYLQPEIRLYEDRDALDGGNDGLDLIKLVLKVSSNILETGGKVILEVDQRHPELIKSYLRENPALGLLITAVHKDVFNNNRFVAFQKMNPPLLTSWSFKS
ncbi:MTRF1L release factor glutamine methyltransferase [Onthophagus taurus]|uniref:MTRF1L release factor glutamine methyltransferase n=1 Tax=Onthophagus taurus TaxID=166361 RepID=UPI0039BE8545